MTAVATRPARTAIASIRSAPDLIRTSFTAFGTFGTLLVTTRPAVRPARELLGRELRAIDLACSRFRPDSELTMLNRAGGRRQPVSPLFAEAIAVALRAAAATDGDVDPTCGQSLVRLGYDRDFAQLASRWRAPAGPVRPVPAGGWQCVDLDRADLTVRLPAGVHLDLGATAKALAADRAARTISMATGAGVLVNLGGDIAVAGLPPAAGWRVEIVADPADGGRRPVIALRDGGLATSSTGSRAWRRGVQMLHHILDPRTGRSADSCWTAVSVAAATCVDANSASTAAIIRSAAAPGWLASLGLPARLVGTDGTIMTTGAWPDEL
ncbi:MAG TPA: FAD:protein FMN transferase [Streptosporangiaceae bacterium]|nr:FAD:protein FMN transferase [Streptosporangiaceae bacterium]